MRKLPHNPFTMACLYGNMEVLNPKPPTACPRCKQDVFNHAPEHACPRCQRFCVPKPTEWDCRCKGAPT